MTDLRYRLLGLAAGVLGSGIAAAGDVDHRQALELRRSGVILPLETMLATVQDRYPESTVVEVELEQEARGFIYDIEIFNAAGELRELELDARTGEIVQDALED